MMGRIASAAWDAICCGPAGADAVEPAGEQGLAEPVADELLGLGDADVDRPFLDHDAGEPGRVRRGAHRLGGAQDGDSVRLEVDVPVRNLPARILRDRVDPVAGLASAGVAEHCRRARRHPAGSPGPVRPGRPTAALRWFNTNAATAASTRPAGSGSARMSATAHGGLARGIPGQHVDREVHGDRTSAPGGERGAGRPGARAGVEHGAPGERMRAHRDAARRRSGRRPAWRRSPTAGRAPA